MSNEPMDTIAKRVRRARMHAGLESHAALASRIGRGVKAQTIQSIESGRTGRSKFLPDIALATGVRIEWLLHNDGPMVNEHQVQESALSPYQTLSPEAIEVARAWQQLPPDRANFFRDLIYYEAVISRLMPWLRRGRPKGESYDQFERSVESDIRERQKQLALFDPLKP